MTELIVVGRTFKKRADDALAYFDHPSTPNTPTKAINSLLAHPHANTLGFWNLTHYATRTLLKTRDLRPHLHPQL